MRTLPCRHWNRCAVRSQRSTARGDRCDFAKDVAFLYPLHVIMEVIGVPESDEPRMLKLTQELFSAGDPELNRNKAEVTPAEALQQLVQTNADLEAYFAFIAPSSMSKDVVSRLNLEINRLLFAPEMQEKIKSLGFSAIPRRTPEEFASRIEKDLQEWGAIVKSSNITVD